MENKETVSGGINFAPKSAGSITIDVKLEGMEEALEKVECLKQAINEAISRAGELAKVVKGMDETEIKLDEQTVAKIVRLAIRDNRAASQRTGEDSERP